MGKDKSIYDEKYQALVVLLALERKRLNISQAELASAMGLHQSDVSKIEKLERRLDVLEFSRMLHAFRVGENATLASEIRNFLGIPNE